MDNNFISKRIIPLFKNIPPKLEDKILIGLGALFLCNAVAFVYFANAFFNRPSLMDQIRFERIRAQDVAWNDRMDKIFEDVKNDFGKFNDVSEDDKRRTEEIH